MSSVCGDLDGLGDEPVASDDGPGEVGDVTFGRNELRDASTLWKDGGHATEAAEVAAVAAANRAVGGIGADGKGAEKLDEMFPSGTWVEVSGAPPDGHLGEDDPDLAKGGEATGWTGDEAPDVGVVVLLGATVGSCDPGKPAAAAAIDCAWAAASPAARAGCRPGGRKGFPPGGGTSPGWDCPPAALAAAAKAAAAACLQAGC